MKINKGKGGKALVKKLSSKINKNPLHSRQTRQLMTTSQQFKQYLSLLNHSVVVTNQMSFYSALQNRQAV
jgi:hypothetical protein